MSDMATYLDSSSTGVAVAEPVARKLTVRSYGLTDRGRVRPTNEDAFLIAELAKAMRVRQSSLNQADTHYGTECGQLFLVADGMGGHQAGEQASSLAVLSIERFALDTLKWFFHLEGPEEQNVLAEFQTALHQADQALFHEAARRPEWRGMGTTLTMAYRLDSDLFVIHVGDSRCYLHRDGRLTCLTRDHTLTDELVRRGAIEPEEAAHHPYRHIITNCVGGTEEGVDVEARKLELAPGDVILLCSDGLTEMVKDDAIAAVLHEEDDPRRACERLIAMANAAGGKDNITVVVARFDGQV
jgi:serine/threonine protein phosphatase PrpC